MTTCHICKGRVVEESIRHVHHWGNEIVIFDDVPAEVCQQCGEVYFSPEVLERMDKAALTEVKPKTVVSIPAVGGGWNHAAWGGNDPGTVIYAVPLCAG